MRLKIKNQRKTFLYIFVLLNELSFDQLLIKENFSLNKSI
jgi:hypothetical protein